MLFRFTPPACLFAAASITAASEFGNAFVKHIPVHIFAASVFSDLGRTRKRWPAFDVPRSLATVPDGSIK